MQKDCKNIWEGVSPSPLTFFFFFLDLFFLLFLFWNFVCICICDVCWRAPQHVYVWRLDVDTGVLLYQWLSVCSEVGWASGSVCLCPPGTRVIDTLLYVRVIPQKYLLISFRSFNWLCLSWLQLLWVHVRSHSQRCLPPMALCSTAMMFSQPHDRDGPSVLNTQSLILDVVIFNFSLFIFEINHFNKELAPFSRARTCI